MKLAVWVPTFTNSIFPASLQRKSNLQGGSSKNFIPSCSAARFSTLNESSGTSMTEKRPLCHWQRNTGTIKCYDGVTNQKSVQSSISTSFQMLTECGPPSHRSQYKADLKRIVCASPQPSPRA